MQKKIKTIVVSPNKDFVIWSENLENIVKKTTLIVEPGCNAYYVVDGILKATETPGRWEINSKDEYKYNSKLQLICANTDKTLTILCGVGMIPYKDTELNMETVVGAHGECKIRIIQPWTLYSALGHTEITADEIDTYVKSKLAEIMTANLSELLQDYNYDNVMTQSSVIAEKLEKKFADKLIDIGIAVCSFALSGFLFRDEYQEKRQAFFDEQNRKKAEKEERRAKERTRQAEFDNLVAVVKATKDIAPTADTPNTAGAMQTPANNTPSPAPQYDPITNQPVKYCSACGTRTVVTSLFCPGCGKKF